MDGPAKHPVDRSTDPSVDRGRVLVCRPLEARMERLLVLAVASLLLLRVDGQVCPNSGMASPDVVTLVNSLTREGVAMVIGPNCDFEEAIPIRGTLRLQDKGIERVVSVPSQLSFLGLTGNPLSLGANFSSMTGNLAIETFSPKLLSNVVFPNFASTAILSLTDSAITSLKGVVIPGKVETLCDPIRRIEKTQLKSLKGFTIPPTLISLSVTTSKLTAIDLTFPNFLETLSITGSAITKIERLAFPDSLLTLDFTGNAISSIKGVTWPGSLQSLTLTGNPLVELEIRESDATIFDGLTSFEGDFSQVKCSDQTAISKTFKSKSICVISDSRFNSLYGNVPATKTPVTRKPTTKRPSSSASDASASTSSDEELPGAEGDEDNSLPSSTTDASSESSNYSEDPTTPSSSTTEGAIDISRRPPSNVTLAQSEQSGSGSSSEVVTTIIQTKTSSNKIWVIVLAGICSVVAVLLGICAYRVCFTSKKNRKPSSPVDGTYSKVDTPEETPGHPSNNTVSAVPSEEYLANDVRNDKAILPFRIVQKDVKLGSRIARGGYGVIYRAKYDGRDVAVKQMLPGTWQDDRALASFMDEIRLCASLDHPKIVAFVGIAYSSLRDLSVVIEFMPGGDLHVLLQKQQELPRSTQDWTQPWASAQIKPKASIGQDVAEAVAYLHSRETPILHRDLKARNVLLDLEGNAKLSDFGISRELKIDETMTSEVGTAAWIAPEVLRGARYSEKADIYSLGVLLVELDRCQHPYAGEPVLQQGGGASVKPSTMSHVAQKNTQIAVLVSTGKLRPAVRGDCPVHVAELVGRCLSFDPEDRPSAADVANVLSESVSSS